jgi:4-oxalocrotonate tautomerase
MPLAQITLWEGRSEEKREELIQKVTDAIQETLDCPRQAVTVVLQEVPKADWGQGGVPASKRT